MVRGARAQESTAHQQLTIIARAAAGVPVTVLRLTCTEEGVLQFHISNTEQPLIAAAINLGDWIASQREVTRKQRRIISEVQQALRTLPMVNKGITGEYGFQLRNLNGDGLLYRAWRVALSPAGLEIYSVYSPEKKIELTEKMANELNYWIRPGESSGHNGHYLAEWIDEVSDPGQFRPESIEFGIYAAYFD